MTPNQLAGLISISVALGVVSAGLMTRRIVRRPASAGAGIVIVAAWTILVGGIPYAIFALGASAARGHGSLTGIASVVIGVLPLILVAAPIAGLVFTIRHFSHHVHTHFSADLRDGTIPEPEQDRSHGIRDRDTGDSRTAPDRPEDHSNPRIDR